MVERIKQSAGEPDLTALLVEAEDALRAIRHGNAGLQRDMDPAAESQRLADAWKAIY